MTPYHHLSSSIVIEVVKKPLDFSKGFFKQCNEFTNWIKLRI